MVHVSNPTRNIDDEMTMKNETRSLHSTTYTEKPEKIQNYTKQQTQQMNQSMPQMTRTPREIQYRHLLDRQRGLLFHNEYFIMNTFHDDGENQNEILNH